ncbi:MAG TPA: thioredoxin [Longimicrobium sp.]|jgi:thioredoxin 2
MDATASRKATVACSSCGRLNRVDLSRASAGPKCGACGRPIALDRPLAVTDSTFDPVVGGSDVPVLVDFYADWCGPCKIMAPVLDAVAQARAGSMLVAKLDTDRNPVLARRFQIASIPTLIVFRGGHEVGRELGAIPRPRLEALLDGATR